MAIARGVSQRHDRPLRGGCAILESGGFEVMSLLRSHRSGARAPVLDTRRPYDAPQFGARGFANGPIARHLVEAHPRCHDSRHHPCVMPEDSMLPSATQARLTVSRVAVVALAALALATAAAAPTEARAQQGQRAAPRSIEERTAGLR